MRMYGPSKPWQHARRFRLAALGAICLLGAMLPTSVAKGVGRHAEFVEALRERGWNDTAEEYLDFAKTDPTASEEFRGTIAFEKARLLMAMAKHTAGSRQRADLQQQAVAMFLQFAKEHPKKPQSLQSLQQAGNLLVETALRNLAQLEKLPSGARSEQNRLRSEARQGFDEATSVITRLQQACEKRLSEIPKPTAAKRDATRSKLRSSLQSKLAEARFLLPKIQFDKSRTYPEDSKEFKQTVEAAVGGFTKLAKDYDDKLIGFYGRLYEGRCFQTLGDTKKALRSYEELVFQPIQDAVFRQLLTRAYRRRAECFRIDKNYDEAIRECRGWIKESRSNELRRPEWLALKYQLAGVYLDKSGSLPKKDAQLESNARRLLREVARETGQFQQPARSALASLGQNGAAGSPLATFASVPLKDIKTFADALASGTAAMEQMNASKLAARLARENNPGAAEGLQQQAQTGKANALRFFEHALQLADQDTEQGQLNKARYYLCWLYWEEGRLLEASIMGEFLARHYPESPFAPAAGKVALAAMERLYNQSRSSSQSQINPAAEERFESEQLAALATLVIERWPKSEEGAAAGNLLVNIAVREGNLDDAESRLQQLPESSRATAQLSLGSALWSNYLKQAAETQGEPDETAIALRRRAEKHLERGFEQSQSAGEVSASGARGALYLAQLLLSQGDASQAAKVLEASHAGPLSLIRKRSDAVKQPGFAEEIYKTALRAYISVTPPKRKQALAMMESLEKTIAESSDSNSSTESKKQLTRIYVSLGLQLQKQVEQLSASGKTAEAGRVAAAFEDILERVSQQGDTGDWAVRNWIAQTNLQLGEGLRGDGKTTEEAQRYFEQAEKAYRSILLAADKDPQFAPSPTALLGVKKRMADCQRGLGHFDEALEQYSDILRQKPNMLELQRAAASTLQEKGTSQQDTGAINRAIRGAKPQADKKNLIWGWLRLATIADYATRKTSQSADSSAPATQQKIAKYRNLFFEARYNAAKSRFLAAKFTTGDEKKKNLNTAKQSIRSMRQLYPDLGGKKWKKAFDDLLEEINEN